MLSRKVGVNKPSCRRNSADLAETITSYTTTPLKSVLRTIHRLMQMTGGAEGLRNLVDSDLPKLLRGIFKDASTYGNRVFASGKTASPDPH
jgi:hypothetical protein